MKNQYIGDINDYHKYGLLEIIGKTLQKKILVVWMLTSDDDSKDGKKRKYLEKSKYKEYNENLYIELQKLCKKNATINDMQEILKKETYISNFISNFLTDDEIKRNKYFEEVYKKAEENSSMVFFDPDNGLEVSSRPYGKKDSSKHIFWVELSRIWDMGKDILVYQHFSRIHRQTFIIDLSLDCIKRLKGASVLPIVTNDVLFLYITREDKKRIDKLKDKLNSQWEDEYFVLQTFSEDWIKTIYKAGWHKTRASATYKDWLDLVWAVESKWFLSSSKSDLILRRDDTEHDVENKPFTGEFYDNNKHTNVFYYFGNVLKFHNAMWFTPPTAITIIETKIQSDLIRIKDQDIKNIKLTKNEYEISFWNKKRMVTMDAL
jgi:hypothetical protein